MKTQKPKQIVKREARLNGVTYYPCDSTYRHYICDRFVFRYLGLTSFRFLPKKIVVELSNKRAKGFKKVEISNDNYWDKISLAFRETYCLMQEDIRRVLNEDSNRFHPAYGTLWVKIEGIE